MTRFSYIHIRFQKTYSPLMYQWKLLFSASYLYFPETFVLFNLPRLYFIPLEFTFTTIDDLDSSKTENYT